MRWANDEEKKAYFRALGSKGGKSTVARHGTDHMSAIGRKGFEATASHFHSVEAYKSWLAGFCSYLYWASTGLPPKYGEDGIPIFPTEKPVGPWDPQYTEF